MTLPRKSPTMPEPTPAGDDAVSGRDALLTRLAREASLLALATVRAAAPAERLRRQGLETARAMATLAAETERVARRVGQATEAMRALGPGVGPSDERLAAAAAAMAAARAIGAHAPNAAEGARVAAEGFAAAASALGMTPAQRSLHGADEAPTNAVLN